MESNSCRARSTVAHSGTSIAADARGNKRKRLPPGNRYVLAVY